MVQSETEISPGKELKQFVTNFNDKYAEKYQLAKIHFDADYVSDCIDLEQETDIDLSSNFANLKKQDQHLKRYQLVVLTIPAAGNTFTVSLVTRQTMNGASDDMLNGYGSPYTSAEPDTVLAQETKTLSGDREETLCSLID